MNTGIIFGMVTILVAILLNYLNLFCYRDYSNGTHEGEKEKHWLITYYVSWLIAMIPFAGLILELFYIWFRWTFYPSHRCTSRLFQEI